MHFLSLLIFVSAFAILCLWINFQIEKRRIVNFSIPKHQQPEDNHRQLQKHSLCTPKLPVRPFDAERQVQNFYQLPDTPISKKFTAYEEPNKENFFHSQMKCTLDYTPTLSSKLS